MVFCSFSSFLPRFAAGEEPDAALRLVPAAAGELCEFEGLESGCDCEDAIRADLRAMLSSDGLLARMNETMKFNYKSQQQYRESV